MKRRLSDADRRAWEAYRQTAEPLPGHKARATLAGDEAPGKPGATQAPDPKPPASPAPAFRVGQRVRTSTAAHDLAPSLKDGLKGSGVTMDRKAWHRLRAGKLRPEAKLDLHGMTLETAHPTLLDFVMRNHAAGRRLLLVVTGKGKRKLDEGPIPTRLGVLRHQVPQWLRMPPVAPLILEVAQAHQSHGGLGAYYVYLRRNR